MGVDVLYFAADIAEVKAAVGRRLCLMGNLPHRRDAARHSREHRREAKRCIAVAEDDDGGFVLAPSGALIPGTPIENIRAMAQFPSTLTSSVYA